MSVSLSLPGKKVKFAEPLLLCLYLVFSETNSTSLINRGPTFKDEICISAAPWTFFSFMRVSFSLPGKKVEFAETLLLYIYTWCSLRRFLLLNKSC